MDREFTRPAENLGRSTAEYIDLKGVCKTIALDFHKGIKQIYSRKMHDGIKLIGNCFHPIKSAFYAVRVGDIDLKRNHIFLCSIGRFIHSNYAKALLF